MPRLARPKRRAGALHGDEFPPSSSITEQAFVSVSPSSSSSLPSTSPLHPLDATVEALRSLPTFRMVTGGPQPPFASLSWPFGGGEAGKIEGEKQRRRSSSSGVGALSSSFASTSTSASSNSSPALPAVPDDLLKKASALEKTTTTTKTPIPSLSAAVTGPEAAKDRPPKTATAEEKEKPKESTSSSFSLWPPRLPSSLPSLPSLPLLVSLSAPGGDPDKGRLLSVADFFDHARANSRRLWQELDGDGDGWATEGDVARALAARGLPTSYAPRVLAAARGNARWWATRVSRREFAAWMERGEPRALRAFTSMPLDRSGRVDVRGIKAVLQRSGVAATDDAARGVLRALRSGEDGAASYAQFRSFVALLPPTAGAKASSASGASARRNNGGDDYDDDFAGGGGAGGGAGGFDPATAWFDAASIVPLVSGTPALDEAAAAAVGAKATTAATGAAAGAEGATGAAGAAAPASAAASSSSSSSSSSSPRRAAATEAERSRARQKQRAALLRAALAGGIASGATTLALFPLDTLKTRLQASSSGRAAAAAAAAATANAVAGASTAAATTTLASVVREGLLDKRALYRGVIPASLGSFFSHGLRTFSYEAALMVLTAAGFAGAAGAGAGAAAAVAASAATSSSSSAAAVAVPVSAAAAAASSQLRLQALASAAGTAIGTCVRIPTEVLKQRLQVGLYPNALDAARAARDAGGLPWSLFAGTGATLAREVPFYAAGMAAYEVLKNFADGSATSPTRTPSRELARWEMIALGGCAGAIASLFTTPADVIKTRVMTAPPSAPVSAVAALTSILRNEGVLALWRGAAPRAVWVAPLGAMNFAGYELAKRALEGGGGGGGGRGGGNYSGSSGSGGESEEANDGDNEDERLKEE